VKVRLQQGLPFITVAVTYQGQTTELGEVLLDTGSAGTVLSVDRLLDIGVHMEPQDTIHRIYGVGGSEFVFAKRVDNLIAGDLAVQDFEIQIGAMAYGIQIDGILGLDFLLAVGAVIDLAELEIHSANKRA
jgi:aspartyl protease